MHVFSSSTKIMLSAPSFKYKTLNIYFLQLLFALANSVFFVFADSRKLITEKETAFSSGLSKIFFSEDHLFAIAFV